MISLEDLQNYEIRRKDFRFWAKVKLLWSNLTSLWNLWAIMTLIQCMGPSMISETVTISHWWMKPNFTRNRRIKSCRPWFQRTSPDRGTMRFRRSRRCVTCMWALQKSTYRVIQEKWKVSLTHAELAEKKAARLYQLLKSTFALHHQASTKPPKREWPIPERMKQMMNQRFPTSLKFQKTKIQWT